MKTKRDVVDFIAQRPDMMRLIGIVEALSLPDCWIGAGFVRNAVWDPLHGNVAEVPGDVDVAWFDAVCAAPARDAAIEAHLCEVDPRVRWDVKNQARMHVRNGDAPYRNVEAAIACWPETATAVAVRKHDGRLELIAPYGIDDLTGLIVRPTPAFLHKADIIARRVREKGWRARWPRLRMH
jgi:hypothetical protein